MPRTKDPPPLESAITTHVLQALRSRGGRWTKIHGHAMQSTTLDIIGGYRGVYVEMEVKRKGQKPTPRQQVIIRLVREDGQGVAAVVYSAAEAVEVLRVIDGELARLAAGNHPSLRHAIVAVNTLLQSRLGATRDANRSQP